MARIGGGQSYPTFLSSPLCWWSMAAFSRKDLQFMRLAIDSAEIFSTCGKRQYACYITDKKDRIVGFGYNGGPRGSVHCKDGGCPRLQENSPSGSSYSNCIAVHAETNAIANSIGQGTNLYVNGTPCHDCAKIITSTDIKRLIYIRDPSYPQWTKSYAMLEAAGVMCLGLNMEAMNARV